MNKNARIVAAAALMTAAFCVAPPASAFGLRDVLRQAANEAIVQQHGRGNGAATTQNGAANGSMIEQTGEHHTASVRQNGDTNTAAIRQFGANNAGAITQNGSGNDACLVQVGRNVSGEIVQNGDNETTGVLQTRRAAVPIPVELCQDYHGRHAGRLVMQAAWGSMFGVKR